MSRVSSRLLLAQSADAATYLLFMLLFAGASVHSERNPLIVALMAIGGIWAIAIVKIGSAAWCAWRFEHPPKESRFSVVRRVNQILRVERWWRPTTIVMMSVATASGIVGAGFNVASLIDSL